MDEKVQRLYELRESFNNREEAIISKQEELNDLFMQQQSDYDEYFNLYKEIEPESMPNDLLPSLIPPVEVDDEEIVDGSEV